MENRINKAKEIHNKGGNCCQAVVCAFADLLNKDEETLYSAAEGFGLGMGNMNCTCGAVSGMVMLAGLKNSSGSTDAGSTKRETYKIAAEMTDEFKKEVGTVICSEIKGVNSGKCLKSCSDCIAECVKIAEKKIFG
ncbi:MAG: C-GCAxxG-C-C family protein [Ruminococcus sp.]|nr:C_GCAxxG_C_C family protein [Ruminococcus sp.]CDF02612.1 putative uncharacterized protein [Ruminococcus sp. CAG:624]MCI6890325.1 C-GCAxxG-C-C family protein [Ruminococcus sp.]MDD6634895.1 C-GCAxxG-C-C family protein [Ruminococcus sp.]MDY3214923.1 C-GCAxxG-C-C family protein [Ruminococcus sp.]